MEYFEFTGNTFERRGQRCVKSDGYRPQIFTLQEDGVPLGMKIRFSVKASDLERREEDPQTPVFCRVLAILGNASDPDIAMKALIQSYELDRPFLPDSLSQAEQAAGEDREERIREELERGRRDLRNLKTFTLDGTDAKDLDDAISVENLGGGKLRLWVHIADVAHFVEADTALDQDAFLRGNSTYLPGMVFPMLPTALSNDLCSLNPQEDRLAVSVAMNYDENGKLLSSKVFESVIRSDLRADYRSLRQYFAGTESGELSPEEREAVCARFPEKYAALSEELFAARKLSFLLREKRLKSGALDFAFTEAKVLFDENGKITGFEGRAQSWTEQMIEEFMIAANETVARRARIKKIPVLYRSHDEPDRELLLSFTKIANDQGLRLTVPEHPTPKLLSEWIEQIKKLDCAELLMTLLLRSLAKARYDAEPLGHFGLSLKDYCHFTSPIRRYSDLFTHRALKNELNGRSNHALKRAAAAAADQVSETELHSMHAERDAVKLCMALYMEEKIGEVFRGTITGFCALGAFIRLENCVEGLAEFSCLDEHYEFDPLALAARAEKSRRVLKVGDPVCVRVRSVSVAQRTIDFEYAGEQLPGTKYMQKKSEYDRLFEQATEVGYGLRRRYRLSGFEHEEPKNAPAEIQTLGHGAFPDGKEKEEKKECETSGCVRLNEDDAEEWLYREEKKRERKPYNRAETEYERLLDLTEAGNRPEAFSGRSEKLRSRDRTAFAGRARSVERAGGIRGERGRRDDFRGERPAKENFFRGERGRRDDFRGERPAKENSFRGERGRRDDFRGERPAKENSFRGERGRREAFGKGREERRTRRGTGLAGREDRTFSGGSSERTYPSRHSREEERSRERKYGFERAPRTSRGQRKTTKRTDSLPGRGSARFGGEKRGRFSASSGKKSRGRRRG